MIEDPGTVAVALADLRGAVAAGFAKLDGRLDVSLQRTDTLEREVRDLKRELADVKSKIWRFSVAAAAVGGGSAAGAFQLMQ